MDRADHTAHFRPTRSQQPAGVSILDDRGIPTLELELPSDVGTTGDAERHLSEAGWSVTADWTATDDGWTAPVSR